MSDATNYSHDLQMAADDLTMADALILTIPGHLNGVRLDKAMASLLNTVSRGRIQTWIEAGQVFINGHQANTTRKVYAGESITAQPLPDAELVAFSAEPIALHVVAQNDGFLVLDKPAGQVVHPGAGNWSGTTLNGLLHAYPGQVTLARAGLVHRLDKDTSGLMVVARHAEAQLALVKQIQARQVKRGYLAIVQGHVPADADRGWRIEAAIGRDPRQPIRMASRALANVEPIAPKPAVTHVRAVARGKDARGALSLVVCWLETGRTHQIRVHLAGLRHPLLGDALYGGRVEEIAPRQMLHASILQFEDPVSGTSRRFECVPPADMLHALTTIEWDRVVDFEALIVPALLNWQPAMQPGTTRAAN